MPWHDLWRQRLHRRADRARSGRPRDAADPGRPATPKPIEQLAPELAATSRAFALDDAAQLASNLPGATAVMNCAGPFSQTARPMMDACLQAGIDYLDITGEIDVIESAASRNDRAKAAGVARFPAVGFDVVPSDCLAAMLADRLPGATHLQLGFQRLGEVSPARRRRWSKACLSGGRARIDGKIRACRPPGRRWRFPFAEGRALAMTIPWGDVASAYYSTGIPEHRSLCRGAGQPDPSAALDEARHSSAAAQACAVVCVWHVTRTVRGPSAQDRATARAQLWGRVTNGRGESVSGTLTTPEGYHLTKLTALASLEKILTDSVPPGFYTPSRAFGKDFVLQISGVEAKL